MGELALHYRDHDNEASTVRVPGSDFTAINIDAEYIAMLLVQTTLGDVLLGNLVLKTETAKRSPQGVGAASDSNAQRESKALVQYYDDTTFERGTMECPCPDLDKMHPDYPGVFYDANHSGHHADWNAAVAALEAYLLPPGGNTAVIEKIIHVGRNI